jgi:hypothetical protein
MCTPSNLRLIFMCLTLLKGAQMTYFIGFGIITAVDLTLHQAYGRAVKGVGIMITLVGIFGGLNMVIGLKGSLDHNKFLLLLHAILDIFLLSSQVILGWSLLSLTIPTTLDVIREDCARSIRKRFTADEDCPPYVQSLRTSGFQIVWKSYYYESGNDPDYYQKIIDIQRAGQCCGFLPPMQCQK